MHTPTPVSPAVRLRIAEFRQRAEGAGLHTDGEIAEALGVHRITVWRILTEQNPPGESFIAAAIARLPDTRFDDVFAVVDPVATTQAGAA